MAMRTHIEGPCDTQSGGSPTGEAIRAAALPPAASAVAKLPWPQGKEKGSVRFAPRLEKVSEGQSTGSAEAELADSPAASPPKRTRPSRYPTCAPCQATVRGGLQTAGPLSASPPLTPIRATGLPALVLRAPRYANWFSHGFTLR